MVSRDFKLFSVPDFRQIENLAMRHLGSLIKANQLARNKTKNLSGSINTFFPLKETDLQGRGVCVCVDSPRLCYSP